jgi:hypothetical protein
MTGATTRQPVSKEIEATRSKGYTKSTDDVVEQGFLYIPLAPAGAATATALDMARLMVELLNPQDTSILSAASKAQLLSGAYISDPLVNGMTLGMYEMTTGGARAVGHGGNTLLFNSQMVLWPDEDMGLFVSSNTLASEGVATALVEVLADGLGFSSPAGASQEVRGGARFVGEYISARRNHSNFSKLFALIDTARVSYDQATRTLWVEDNRGSKRYGQIGEDVFAHINGVDRIVFKGAYEQATELYFSNRPMLGYTRASQPDIVRNNVFLLALWIVLSVGVLLIWPVSSLTHRNHSRRQGQALAGFLSYLPPLLMVLFILHLGASLGGPYESMVGGMAKIAPLLWYPVAFAALVFLRFLYLYKVWFDGFWWPSRRLHYTLLLFAECALLWWFWYWNLIPETLLSVLK